MPAGGRASMISGLQRGARVGAMLLTLVAGGACTRVIVETPPPTAPRGADAPEVRPEAPLPGAQPREYSEVRAAWVVRTSLDSPEEVRSTVAEARAAGFNTLLVQVRGRGNAFYQSSIEPRATRLPATSFDPLGLLVEEAHAVGIAVHAWVVAHLVWGLGALPEEPTHLVNEHPDWLAVPRELSAELWGVDPYSRRFVRRLHEWTVSQEGRVEGLFVNPALPAVRRRLAEVSREIAERYPVDGVHLDYIRYASPEFDYSRASLEAFAEWMGGRVGSGEAGQLDRQVESGSVLAWAERYPEEFSAFRREQVDQAVSEVRRVLSPLRRPVTLSAAVFADPVDARRARYQDWPDWMRRGLIDVAAPMAYTSRDDRFQDLVRAARDAEQAAADGVEVWMGLGIYQDTFDGALRKLSHTRAAGFRGAVLFSWDWARWDAPGVGSESWLEAFTRRAFRRGG